MEYSDSQLIEMVNEQSSEAKDVLYAKYKYIIDFCVKKYVKAAIDLGIDYNDLYQEALVGFTDALNTYQSDKNTSFPTFIRLCIERRLNVCIIKAGRIKNKVLNSSLSLDEVVGTSNSSLRDMISDNNVNDPLEKISKNEMYEELVAGIENTLSDNEMEVYPLMLNGYNYKEIATKLGKEPKQIDNTIQRIKIKIKKILDER